MGILQVQCLARASPKSPQARKTQANLRHDCGLSPFYIQDSALKNINGPEVFPEEDG